MRGSAYSLLVSGKRSCEINGSLIYIAKTLLTSEESKCNIITRNEVIIMYSYLCFTVIVTSMFFVGQIFE